MQRPGISLPANRPTVLQGDVAVVGRLQELPTKALLSMEASWRAVVVGAVLPMAVVDAAAGVPPSGLLATLQRRSGLLARRGERERIRTSSEKLIQGRVGSGAGTCKTRALLVLWACTASARRNARMAKTARDQVQIHRSGLETISKLLDNLFWTDGKVHNTNLQSCQICSCPQGV